jgi:Uma2 family endonuclease
MTVQSPAPAQPAALVTAEELWLSPGCNQRCELVRGEIIEKDPSGGEHGEIATTLAILLGTYIRNQRLGRAYGAETGFILGRNPDTVRGADFAFIAQARLPQAAPIKGFVPMAPDLAVEIVSPSDRTRDVSEKVREYLMAGAGMIWIIEPELRTVTVYRSLQNARILTANDSLSGDEVVPGFTCQVAELFVG